MTRDDIEFADVGVYSGVSMDWTSDPRYSGQCRQDFPVLKTSYSIPNPKDRLRDMDNLRDGARDIISSSVTDDIMSTDVVLSMTIPFAIVDSLMDDMRDISTKMKNAFDDHTKHVIVNAISSSLLLIPVAGSAFGKLATTLTRMFAVTGEMALAIYNIVTSKDVVDVFMNLLGAALAAMCMKTITSEIRHDAIKTTMNARRNLFDSGKPKLSPKISNSVNRYEKHIVKMCV